VLQKLVFESFFQLVENNLRDKVTSISIGYADPWAYRDFSSLMPSGSVTLGDIAIRTSLKYLDLSNNKFTELAAFKLPKLEYLDISYNKLEKINEGW
jgi:Leucine-rich repeat (LRR) protein